MDSVVVTDGFSQLGPVDRVESDVVEGKQVRMAAVNT